MKCLQHKGSKVIQTKKDADIQISNAPLILSLFKSITPIGEAIPRLDLLLYHVLVTNCTYLYFHWSKAKSNVYYIKELGESAYIDILFLYVYQMRHNVHRIVDRKEDVVQKDR